MRSTLIFTALLFSSSAFAANVDVCHVSGNSGNVLLLTVNSNAIGSHLAHGDWLPTDFFVDVDGDGYGDSSATVYACVQPVGTAILPGDCDDDVAAVNPGAPEVCDNGIDDNCDGQIDEGCLVEVEIMVASDNAHYVWIDGLPYSGANRVSWAESDTYSLMLPAGPHSVAVYVEDWGGYGWFASSVSVDGQIVTQTGDGTWFTNGVQTAAAYGNTYTRGDNWPATPADGVTGLEVVPPTNWIDTGFDDSNWPSAEICGSNVNSFLFNVLGVYFQDHIALQADGTSYVNTDGAACSSGSDWQIGLYRGSFSL